jgi:quercetin dioxygenase-like cupin family protein
MDAARRTGTAAPVMIATRLPDGGTDYLFEYASDVIAMHHHEPGATHDLRVIEGSVEVYSPPGVGAWTRTYRKGDYVKLPHGWHEIRALADGTRTIHKPLGTQ